MIKFADMPKSQYDLTKRSDIAKLIRATNNTKVRIIPETWVSRGKADGENILRTVYTEDYKGLLTCEINLGDNEDYREGFKLASENLLIKAGLDYKFENNYLIVNWPESLDK